MEVYMTISRDMTAAEASVLNYIKNKATHELPIEASSIRDVFHYDKRTLENIIESLRVNFGHPIVAKKQKPNGYYIPKTQEEREEGLAPYKRQILTEQKNLAAIMAVDLEEYWRN